MHIIVGLLIQQQTVQRCTVFNRFGLFHFAALDICPVDTKALYRRCLALEQTERYEDAYKDARKLIQLEPKNTAIQPVLRRLHAIIQDKV